MPKLAKFVVKLLLATFGLFLVIDEVRSVAPGQDYMPQECIAYLEIDTKFFKEMMTGKYYGKPDEASADLITEYMKVYKGPTSEDPVIMRQILNRHRRQCPLMQGFTRTLFENLYPRY